MRAITIITATGSLMLMMGCTNLNDFNKLPSPEINSVRLDLNERNHPQVAIEYCISNHLPTDVDLANTDFKFYINELLVDSSSDNLKDETIKENGRLCREYRMHPDTTNNAQAASAIYQRMLDRNYRLDATLNFEDEDVAPTSGSAKGVFKSTTSGVITGSDR